MLAISGGCSFFYELNTTQCEVTSDCAGLGIENARCENRVCVPNDSSGGTAGDSGRGGDAGDAGRGGSTQGGGGSGGGGGGGAGGASSGTGGDAGGGGSPECTTNGDCIDANVDQPYICKSGSCISVTTESCRLLLPSGKPEYLRSDGVMLVGAFASFVNQSDPHDTLAAINWDLALTEFNEATLDGMLLDSRSPRPIVAVVCDGLDEDVTPSVEHLVQNLEVPAILSTLPVDKLYGAYQTAEQLAEESSPSVFFMSTGSADLRLANLDDNGLVWHMLGDPRLLAETAAQLLLHVEPTVNEVRQQNFMTTGEDDPMNVPLRVALVSSSQTTLIDIATVLTTTSSQFPERTLTFNGKTAAENGTDFRWIEIKPQQANPNLPDTAAVLGALQANPPHVIVAMATEEFVTGVLASLERNWGTGTAPATADLPRPHYILSHLLYNRPSLTTALGALSDITPPLESRLLGVNYALASDARAQRLYTDYLLRLQSSYDPMGALYSSLPGTENYYDGAYSLLYSIAAAERFRPTPDGLNVRDALEQRVFSTAGSAEDIDIGPGEVASVVQNGTTISLYGTMGAPDFDRLSGTRINPTSAWCIQQTMSSTFAFQSDALLYDRENQQFGEPTGGPPDCAAGY